MGRVKGSKSGKIITASLDGRVKKDFPELDKTKVLILVSIVGNEYCEGEYLHSTMKKAISDHKLATVLLADEVYWHNLRTQELESPEKVAELKAQALKIGDVFFEENLPSFLDVLSINAEQFSEALKGTTVDAKIRWLNGEAKKKNIGFEIKRWQDWVQSPQDNLNAMLAELSQYYEKIPILKNSIRKTAEEFAARHQTEGSQELWLYRSDCYLQDESPCVMWGAANRGYEFIAYPGDFFLPFKATKEFFVGEPKEGLLDKHRINRNPKEVGHWLDVHFKRSMENNIDSIDPNALVISQKKFASFFKANIDLVKEQNFVPNKDIVMELTSGIMSDDSIQPDIRLTVLLSALDMLQKNSMDVENVAPLKNWGGS